MSLNAKSVSDGSIYGKRLYSFEEPCEEKNEEINKIPSPIQEVDAFDPAEYWEAINDRDKRIETLYFENEQLCHEKVEQVKKNESLLQDNEAFKRKIQEMEQEYAESCKKYEKNIVNLEQRMFEIKDKLEKSSKLIENFEESNKILENLVKDCKNEGIDISEETVDFQTNLEKNYEQMIMIENATTNIFKESLESLKANYEEKLNIMQKTYEEKVKNENNEKNIEEIKQDLMNQVETIREMCEQLRQEKSSYEEKAKNLGYKNLDEALEQNKLLWEELTNLRKAQETYKNENESLHHELDSSIERLDKKENDIKEIILEKEKEFQQKSETLLKQYEEKINLKINEFNEITIKYKESQDKLIELQSQNEKDKVALHLVQTKYQECLQKIHKDSESMKKMMQTIEENENTSKEYLLEISQIKTSKIQQMGNLSDISKKLTVFKKDLAEIRINLTESQKKINSNVYKKIEAQIFSYFDSLKRNDNQIKNQNFVLKPDFLRKRSPEGKDLINISRNMTTMETEEKSKFSYTPNENPLKFMTKNCNDKHPLTTKPYFSEVQDFSQFTQKVVSSPGLMPERTEEKITKDLKDLKQSFTMLQGEHMKIVEIVEDNFKGGSNKAKNEFILFNYFEKLFDRLSLSLQKENEIKTMIHSLDEKFDKNFKEPVTQKLEFESLRIKNFRLMQELQEKNEALSVVENERNEYKNSCKELQIQLDFKKAQSKYIKDNQESSTSNIKSNYDVSEIYQKYLKAKPVGINGRRTEVPVKNFTVTPRTPTNLGKDVNKTINKILLDNQRTKNGKQQQNSLNNSMKGSEHSSNPNY